MFNFKKQLMRFIHDIISFIVYLFIFYKRRKGLLTLVYHSVGQVDPSKDIYRLNIWPEKFEEHLKVISRYKDKIKITFDDGYGNNFENAFPLLKKYGLTATIFLVTDFIDGKIGSENFCGGNLKLRPLTWEEIKIMDNSGVVFGSHSKTHLALGRLSRDAIKTELLDSKRRIEELLGHKIDNFAYPFGNRNSFNPIVTEILAEVGYNYAYTNIMGINKDGHENKFGLRRVRIYSEDGPLKLKMKLEGAYDWVDLV